MCEGEVRGGEGLSKRLKVVRGKRKRGKRDDRMVGMILRGERDEGRG